MIAYHRSYFHRPPQQNIMFDRRVIRGNTYAVQTESSNAQTEAQRLHLAQQERRRQEAARASKKRGGKPGKSTAADDIFTPIHSVNRVHIHVSNVGGLVVP